MERYFGSGAGLCPAYARTPELVRPYMSTGISLLLSSAHSYGCTGVLTYGPTVTSVLVRVYASTGLRVYLSYARTGVRLSFCAAARERWSPTAVRF